MNVVPIRSKEFLGEYSSRDKETVPEGAMFLAGAAVTFLAPTLLFCAVIGQLLPLYMIAANEAFGAALGFAMFNRPSKNLSLNPIDPIPKAARGASAIQRRKAA